MAAVNSFRLYMVETYQGRRGGIITDAQMNIITVAPGFQHYLGKNISDCTDWKTMRLLEEVKCPDSA